MWYHNSVMFDKYNHVLVRHSQIYSQFNPL